MRLVRGVRIVREVGGERTAPDHRSYSHSSITIAEMNEDEDELEQARADLDAINDELTALDARRPRRRKLRRPFQNGARPVDEKTNERERLGTSSRRWRPKLEQERKDAARADLMSRRAVLEKQTERLARRITETVPRRLRCSLS